MQVKDPLLNVLKHSGKRNNLIVQMRLRMNNTLQILILDQSIGRLSVECSFSRGCHQGCSAIGRYLRGRRNSVRKPGSIRGIVNRGKSEGLDISSGVEGPTIKHGMGGEALWSGV